MFASLLAVVAAYLIGSLSFAVIVSRLLGLSDPRSYGSGNPGATNVLRSGSKLAAVLTLLLDGAKGWLPVALVHWYGAPYGLGVGTEGLVGLAAFAGHLFPLYFGFKGGKGVATAAGVLLGFQPWLGVATIATWIIIAVFFRYSSLAAIAAAIFAPAYYFLGDDIAWTMQAPLFWAIVIMAIALLTRHRANISRLVAGNESRIGQKKDG